MVPIPITSWAAIPEADMLAYKKTLISTDGTIPEADATTAYDEYSIEKALFWLETEGYDTHLMRTETTTSPTYGSGNFIDDLIGYLPPNFLFGGLILVTISTIIFYFRSFSKKKG